LRGKQRLNKREIHGENIIEHLRNAQGFRQSAKMEAGQPTPFFDDSLAGKANGRALADGAGQ
jgi:hypothetical protein